MPSLVPVKLVGLRNLPTMPTGPSVSPAAIHHDLTQRDTSPTMQARLFVQI